MRERLDAVMAQAVAAGLLPEAAVRPAGEIRPWPVVLLTALGAWLAAVPLLSVVGILLGPLVNNAAGPYIVGLLALAGSAVVLRSTSVPLFVEQLAVPGLLVGLGSLGFGFFRFRDLPEAGAALVLAGVSLALALVLRQPWLRTLLGVAMALLVGFALLEPKNLFHHGEHDRLWVAIHVLLAVGLLLPGLQGRWRGHGAAIESISAGWLLTALVGLAALAGMTFLVGGAMGGNLVGEVAREVGRAGRRSFSDWGLPAASALFAVLGAGVAVRRWPGLRHPGLAGVALVAAGLSWFMPALGGVVLALAATLTSRRDRLGAAAMVAFAWIVGAFYYALAWPLATKALVLVAAGAAIGAVAWWLKPHGAAPVRATVAAPRDRRALWLGVGTLAALVVAAGAIWQKQDVIARGQPVYVELAPVDPRSLMQGDYMRLNFRLPMALSELPPMTTAQRPKVVAQGDARGVATVRRVAKPNEALVRGEFLFELTPKNGGWVLVTDAWFFREGEGERWARAKYGEFRVTPEGRALLVGMADAELKPILPEEHP